MSLVIEGFAGPGGWSEGLKLAGFTGTAVGIEWDWAACKTAKAAGHLRVQADVATFPIGHLTGKVDGLIQSPPCQAWSMAGDRKGEVDRPAVFARIAAFADGRVPDVHEWADKRSHLTAEPMRYVVVLKPRWIALEQVPAVLPLWQYMGKFLHRMGYKVWTGILSAEEYGVPQTRKRAILVARRDGQPVGPPEPTHQAYRAGQAANLDPDLFGNPLPPPVTMAEAIGWGMTARPSVTVAAGSGRSGGADPLDGGAGARATLRNAREAGLWEANPTGRHRPTPREAAILQSFPPGYRWQGDGKQQVMQIGNAVPPLLAAAVLRQFIAANTNREAA